MDRGAWQATGMAKSQTQLSTLAPMIKYICTQILPALFSFIFNWRRIALQCCVGFCHTAAWISHRYPYAPPHLEPPSHLPPHPTSLGCHWPPGWAPCIIQQIPTGCLFYIPGEGNGNPLQYSCLESPMSKGAWVGGEVATVQRIPKYWISLSSLAADLFCIW